MTITELHGPPDADLSSALTAFESQFHYPLGSDQSFRITHGKDYPRFFRAIGEATSFVAIQDGAVTGTAGLAVRRLLMPDGTARLVGYIGDLKIAENSRGTRILWRLTQAMRSACERFQVKTAFAVVMDGTSQTPPSYTGRAGLPHFTAVGKVTILRISTDRGSCETDDDYYATSKEAGEECYWNLCHGRYGCPVGSPEHRSEMKPVWLMRPDGVTCGLLEDTRRAKRLIAADGEELRSAHLSCFAFRTPEAGADLLRASLRRCLQHQFPALFVAVADGDRDPLLQALGSGTIVVAPATVYGTGFDLDGAWNINSAEV